MTRESEIEKYLVKRVKANGGEARKVKWIGRKGAPDRRVMLPHCCVWVELKATRKPLAAHQRREHKRMAECNERVLVMDSMEAVDNFIARYKYAISLRAGATGCLGDF